MRFNKMAAFFVVGTFISLKVVVASASAFTLQEVKKVQEILKPPPPPTCVDKHIVAVLDSSVAFLPGADIIFDAANITGVQVANSLVQVCGNVVKTYPNITWNTRLESSLIGTNTYPVSTQSNVNSAGTANSYPNDYTISYPGQPSTPRHDPVIIVGDEMTFPFRFPIGSDDYFKYTIKVRFQ